MAKKRSASSRQERRPKESDRAISAENAAELYSLADQPDERIDTEDMPEVLNWQGASVGRFYRAVKKPISLRVDLDVLAWFQSLGDGYQTRMNEALREYMSHCRQQTDTSAAGRVAPSLPLGIPIAEAPASYSAGSLNPILSRSTLQAQCLYQLAQLDIRTQNYESARSHLEQAVKLCAEAEELE